MQLAISTATAACSVALLKCGTVVAERHELVGRGHAEHLIPMIEALPNRGKAELIWVDCGPGSFTGTRVGLAAARALGLAWGAEVRGFSSLALIAAPAQAVDRIGIALIGGHGELFVQDFATAPLAALSPIESLTPEAAAERIRSQRVLGSGAEALVSARGFGMAEAALPRAADVLVLPESLRDLPPRAIYVRAPDARAA
ncbi:MAG TPA: tRNA (adenosine(37)-N6)-threonylcarbamoyltransferase complex dimerization subunit type 1 TsaB [Pseudolabrys sp.]|nr:tRNA (adenosine(37)-N6)-threonylcarbamoyltransferase complex dimerization subunit type 1 TsaB [Pseudolabrys sp.]